MNFAGVVSGCTIGLNNPELDPDMIPIFRKKKLRTESEVQSKIHEIGLSDPWKPVDLTACLISILMALTLFDILLTMIIMAQPQFFIHVGLDEMFLPS